MIDKIKKIAEGNDVRFKISADKGYIEGNFLPKNKQYFARFYAERVAIDSDKVLTFAEAEKAIINNALTSVGAGKSN